MSFVSYELEMLEEQVWDAHGISIPCGDDEAPSWFGGTQAEWESNNSTPEGRADLLLAYVDCCAVRS